MYQFDRIYGHLQNDLNERFGYVYVIRINGDYKLGKTKNMCGRITTYKSSYSPHSQPDIEILFLQEFNNDLVNRDAERALMEYDSGDMFYDKKEWLKPGFTDKHIINYARAAMDNFLNNWKKEFSKGGYRYKWGSKLCLLKSIKTKRLV